MLFVAGKGGTGKTSVTAALCLLAARRGRQVLGVEVDAKGDLQAALGGSGSSYRPQLMQKHLHVLSLHAEEAFQEYLNVYFKVPRVARVTPLARVFDFIATAVPGPRDMLLVGKVTHEEKRRDERRRPVWDLIVVDCTSSGHVLSQLNAATAMMSLVRGGLIRGQVEWIQNLLSDPARTAVVLTALPEEMPVVETIELHDALLRQEGVRIAACVLNRVEPAPVPVSARRLLGDLRQAPARARLGDAVDSIAADLDMATALHRRARQQARQLRRHLTVPVIEVPVLGVRSGLATSRAIAAELNGSPAP